MRRLASHITGTFIMSEKTLISIFCGIAMGILITCAIHITSIHEEQKKQTQLLNKQDHLLQMYILETNPELQGKIKKISALYEQR